MRDRVWDRVSHSGAPVRPQDGRWARSSRSAAGVSVRVGRAFYAVERRLHHRDLHGYGDEVSWWAGVSIDPLRIALELWRRLRLTT